MSDNRKYVIQPQYGPMIGCLLLATARWFTPPSTFSYNSPRDVTIAFVTGQGTVLCLGEKSYVFSRKKHKKLKI